MDEPTKATKPETATPKTPNRQLNRHSKVALLVCGGIIVLALAFIAGWAGNHHLYQKDVAVMRGPVGGGIRENGGPYITNRDTNPTDGTERVRVSGVVTQVNGNTFTIGGNGTTKTIKTDGNTTYNVDTKKVGVNDSVMVVGTDTNGTLTASSVAVVNR